MTSPHVHPTPLRIGLTGGIGSGKSTVAHMLEQRGAAVIDADAISRRVTAAHGAAMPVIAQVFGSEFVSPQGALERDRMRAHVFANPEAKKTLEAIIHPLVAQETQREAQQALQAGHQTLVFDVPLLVESRERWLTQVDRVLVVDCWVETQIERVLQRNGLSRHAIEKIIAAQAPRAQKLACADWVIHNEGITLDALRQLVEALPLAKQGPLRSSA